MANDPISLLLIGSDSALLEGLSQSLGALGYATTATDSLRDARDLAARRRPLIALMEAELAVTSRGEVLSIPLAPGGALILYNVGGEHDAEVLSPSLQRVVLANIMLPLERQRLAALVQYVAQRVRVTGRPRDTPPEQAAQ
ncbi:MAG TPA: hypothetical protein VN797_04785 [Gemmatimonadaceae bacterium]|jgi:hypothetical protein|nr:hypothetical protein [Gemmatimonadaceae bacterium]